MKFSNLFFVGAALVDATQALSLANEKIDMAAAKSASHASAKYAKDHHLDVTHAVSQANATIKHYEGAKAQAHVISGHKTAPVAVAKLHESDSKHDTVVKPGVGSPKDVVKMAATKAKKAGKDPEVAAKAALKLITQAGAKAGIKPGPKNIVSATAHMAHHAGHDPKKAAIKAAKKIQHQAKKVATGTASASAPKASTKSLTHESDAKHNTVVKPGVGSPKDLVKMAATKAKKQGKDPEVAAKAALKLITQAGAKAGIKPGPKNVVAATAHMAKDAGHDPKKAAIKATKKIQHQAQKVAGKASSAPKVHAAKAKLHDSDSKHNTVVKDGVGSPKDLVKMAATKAKQEGHDPEVAAKAMLQKITKAGAKAGIKPGPKNIVSAAAHLAHHAGHDPKKAALKATKKITDQAKVVAKTTSADTTKPAAHAATASTK